MNAQGAVGEGGLGERTWLWNPARGELWDSGSPARACEPLCREQEECGR